jgi:hypothetical protein
MTSLAPIGGKGLRVRGLKLKRIAIIRLLQLAQYKMIFSKIKTFTTKMGEVSLMKKGSLFRLPLP